MGEHVSQKRKLLATTTLAGLLITTLATPVMAQEAPEDTGFFTMLGRLVTGAGSERVASDVPQAVTVLNQDDIDREQPVTVGDAIERIPGVTTVGSESRWGESFNIRGIGSGGSADEPRIIMTLDGVSKYFEQYRMGSLFTNASFLKRVEVLRGPSSSTLHGSGAIGGVIAMETKDPEDVLEEGDTFAVEQTFDLRSNGNGRESTTLLAFAPDERFGALLGYGFVDSDTVHSADGTEVFGTRGISRTILAKTNLRFGTDLEHSVEASYQRETAFIDDMAYNTVDGTLSWGTVDRDLKDTTSQILYNFNPAGNDLIDLDVQLAYSESDVAMDDPRGIFLPETDYAYESTSLKVENRSEWSGANFENFLTVGISRTDQERRALTAAGGGLDFHPAGDTVTTSLYLQNEWVHNDRLTVIAGARADRQEYDPSDLVTATSENSSRTGYSANLALHYKINSQFAVFGSASYTERMPTIDELYDARSLTLDNGGTPFDPSDDVVAPLDPSISTLTPEASRNFEFGMSWEKDGFLLPDDNFALKGVIFRNDLSGEISRNTVGNDATIDTDDSTFHASLVNLESTDYQGVEIEASWESERHFASLAYAHVSHSNSVTGADIDDVPTDNLYLGIGTRLPDSGLEFGWGANFAAGNGDTAGYGVHDFYVSWKPEAGALQNAELRLGVSNIFDKEYQSNLQSTPRAGRSFNLTLSKTF